MCESCATPAVEELAADEEAVRRGGLSRRGLLAGLGAGLGLSVIGLTTGASTASAASAKNGAWANPALGYFPQGGHYGAPRGGAAHAGQDITNSTGTGVYAAAAGTVIRRSWGGGLGGRTGNALVISHGGNQYTYYGHLSAYRVALNAKVKAGQRIADMGATGNVTGPHLHFETHSGGLGSITNPVTFMTARGVDLGGGWPRLDAGASGATVVVVQRLMTQRGHKLVADGNYGSVSVAAVKKFQASKGLVADGQVGPATWPKLVYTLRQGSSGQHVSALQTALNRRSAGLAVDGTFGSVTTTAVRAYQGLNRLVVDGEAGPVTWQALVG
ncbi:MULTISPECIES: peptidoglycan-binding protein [Streptomyces]|uniref:Metalloendopeptidase n=3 Tax=Streptomyces TaxID=1883 RepID=A0A8H9HQV7_9ACTN|nr:MULTISPECIES: peptidoglycan-binding protein [Streptomyces]NEE31799.1 peptidoglycan DD-metalloendopeptidase family protein [Streptomyces sp. SID7982]NEE53259.1 peptidoglycan DD-metalloendopeptidase family protein [Streptomyces sp. SID8455]NEC12644.1 peptidoglycan DD-metalloendopeptidase family protein [Streptomyces sp. SID8014]PJM83179.1 metalloendopeptidase [Streptomyces sp. TSRI0384-2]RPK90867.1 Glycyl-glycine endopeptidase LytM precursor [Streptomyces sp. ADI98-12]